MFSTFQHKLETAIIFGLPVCLRINMGQEAGWKILAIPETCTKWTHFHVIYNILYRLHFSSVLWWGAFKVMDTSVISWWILNSYRHLTFASGELIKEDWWIQVISWCFWNFFLMTWLMFLSRLWLFPRTERWSDTFPTELIINQGQTPPLGQVLECVIAAMSGFVG